MRQVITILIRVTADATTPSSRPTNEREHSSPNRGSLSAAIGSSTGFTEPEPEPNNLAIHTLFDKNPGVSHDFLLIRREAHVPRSQLATLLNRARAQLGTVDILINNAAVVEPLGACDAVDPAQWAAAIEINVIAPATLSVTLLPGMRVTGWGRIVNVSSSIAAHPSAMPGMNAYASSKAALEAHTLSLAAELAGTGVTVNAFRPGSVDTAMQSWIRAQDPQRIGGDLHGRFIRSHQQESLITPQESAAALIAHLAGQETGQIWDAATPT